MKPRYVAKESIIDRTVAHLSEEIASGRLRGPLAGSEKMAAESGVSRATMRAAMARLVAEGVLARGGPRGSLVVRRADTLPREGNRPLSIAILLTQPMESESREVHLGLLRVSDEIKAAGHTCRFVDFPARYDFRKTGVLPSLIAAAAADAWLLHMPSREITAWFVDAGIHAMALGGATNGLEIAAAGSAIRTEIPTVVRRLIGLGHRRIVYLCTKKARSPGNNMTFTAFRDSMMNAGIKPTGYHTPEWEETPEGLTRLMESLFQLTPPTAIIAYPMHVAYGALAWLNRRGIPIPKRVSFVAVQLEPVFTWQFPGIRPAHLKVGDEEVYYRRIRRWIHNVSAGRRDREQLRLRPTFEEGNTIGPPPKE